MRRINSCRRPTTMDVVCYLLSSPRSLLPLARSDLCPCSIIISFEIVPLHCEGQHYAPRLGCPHGNHPPSHHGHIFHPTWANGMLGPPDEISSPSLGSTDIRLVKQDVMVWYGMAWYGMATSERQGKSAQDEYVRIISSSGGSVIGGEPGCFRVQSDEQTKIG